MRSRVKAQRQEPGRGQAAGRHCGPPAEVTGRARYGRVPPKPARDGGHRPLESLGRQPPYQSRATGQRRAGEPGAQALSETPQVEEAQGGRGLPHGDREQAGGDVGDEDRSVRPRVGP